MSSLTRPTGPETPRTYWIRRALVLVAALLVLALLLWIFLPKGSETVATVPSETPSATASGEASPTGQASSSPTATPTTAASPSATTANSPSASGTPTPSATDHPTTASPSSTPPATSPTPQEPASSSAPAETPACRPADLRVTLTGPPTAKAAEIVDFDLSVINGGEKPCKLTVNSKNLELKIYSGQDRIWSTAHCAKWVPTIGAELKPEEASTWKMAWPGKRSAADCKIRDDAQPKPGTYVATAHLADAKPVQHVMTMR